MRGLFPRAEQDPVLATIQKCIVFLTSANIEPLLLEHGFDSSAWTLASLYLASLGAQLLGEDAPRLVGLSQETTCYVSPEYFAEEYGKTVRIAEERVDAAEVASIVQDAAAARNGWKVILSRCAPTSRPRTALQHLRKSLAAEDTARQR